jgi:hypothetical protein
MTEVIETLPVSETAACFQLDPDSATDEQRIAKHLGPAFRITPIGARRFRCNKYACPDGPYPTGRLAETLVLRVNGTNVEHLSDHEARSGPPRPW